MNNIDDVYVGIEWEPQLTFLNYPKLSVYVLTTIFKDVKVKLKSNDSYDYVLLSIPYEFLNKRIGVDKAVMNVEVRSEPVKLSNLKNEIEKCNIELANFIEKLTFYVGPVGVFIPSLYHKMRVGELTHVSTNCKMLFLTKHVNVSLCPNYLHDEPIHLYYNMIWEYELCHKNKNKFHYCEFNFSWYKHSCLKSQRAHIRVPYLFNDYEFLVSAILNRESKYIIRYDNYDPKLIGYCKKDKYIMINGLT